MTVTAKSDSEDIRIYINGILHLKFPRGQNTRLQSWIEKSTRYFVIEIWCSNQSFKITYEKKDLWVKVLRLLDKHL